LNAGMVGVNHMAISTPETPFGGVNESGFGSESGLEGLEAFQRTKFVSEFALSAGALHASHGYVEE